MVGRPAPAPSPSPASPQPGGAPLPLLVIAGPTAAGKTALAAQVARQVPAEIVSADSMAVYRGLDVGTAKPSAAERQRTRFHLIDYVPPHEPYSLARFLRDAQQAIEEIWARGRLPILCGGTGLYIRALLRGFVLPPTDWAATLTLRRHLQNQLACHGLQALVAELQSLDPQAATSIDLSNPRRVLRALEIVRLTGRPLAHARGRQPSANQRYQWLGYIITCPRAVLYRRIDARVEKMIASGWLEEVRALADSLPPHATARQAIGYRHLLAYLQGQLGWQEAVAQIKRATRHFAKRQLTWWRREEGFHWLGWATAADYQCVCGVLLRAARYLLRRAGLCSDLARAEAEADQLSAD
jgi:tRNA dimethylallyltransferase